MIAASSGSMRTAFALVTACTVVAAAALLCYAPAYARQQQQKSAAAPASLPPTRTNPRDGAGMILIPAGDFQMGEVGKTDLRHTVTLSAYYLYKNLVTVAQYRKFCRATKRKMPLAPRWGWKDDHPIVNVTWSEARAYCDWAGAKLPTEAQWEKAARGTDGRIYPWGNDWDRTRLCWYAQSTAPVGSHPTGASPYGVQDLLGNVVQLCSDWASPVAVPAVPARDPAGPASGTKHVACGACWESHYSTTLSNRTDFPDQIRRDYFGFRACVPVAPVVPAKLP